MTSSQFGCTAIAILTLSLLSDAPAQAQKNGASLSYTFTDLGGLPGLSWRQSEATAINDAGQIVGFSLTAGPSGYVNHPVLWAKDSTGKYVITDLNPIAAIRGFAEGINSQGEVVGGYFDPTTGVGGGFLIRPVTVNGVKVWYQDLDLDGRNDLMTNLGPVGPVSISDNTQMVAYNGSLFQFDPITGNEVVTTLPNGGYPYAINNNRQVTGFFGAGTQAALWQVDAAGNILSVMTLAPLPNNPGSVGKCINGLGQVAGQSYINSVLGSHSRATLWQNGATPTDLGSLANNSSSDALGISTVNGVLQVVGWDYSNHGLRPFLWKNGVMTDLNSLISASGVNLQQASAINTQGQIVGFTDVTVGKQNTESHGFLLTPNAKGR